DLSADELFGKYAERFFYGSDDDDSMKLFSTDYGLSILSGESLAIYKELIPAIKDIADGTTASTVAAMSDSIYSQFSWTYSELGLGASPTEDEVKAAVKTAVSETVDTHMLLECLLEDCSYEMYWYDGDMSISYGISYGSGKASLSSLTFSFDVADEYSAGTYTVDATQVNRAKTAAVTAKEIAEKYAGKTDRVRLEAYRDEICNLVSYDYDAASDPDNSLSDAWQLIYVFDGDENTKVVCEGYSRAFKYLCELGDLNDAACYTVSGTLGKDSEAESHMWNIVSMDGVNYLVDVTNSDTGTIGQDGGLFLVTEEDASSYSPASYYAFTIYGSTYTYTYNSDTISMLGTGILTLGGTETAADISDCTVTLGTTSYIYDGTAKTPAVTVMDGTTELTQGTDYTVSYSGNTNAGTAAATVTGIGSYSGTANLTFTISKADQTVTAAISPDSIIAGETAQITASATAGSITYSSGDTSVATVDDDGVVTGAGEGTTEITVTAAATDNYNSAQTKVSVTVTAGDTLMIRRGNKFYVNYTLKGGNADFSITAGEETDQVLVGDWDGDGVDSICLRRGNVCYFISDVQTMEVYMSVTYGKESDEVLVGDWDGDGKDSLAMRRKGTTYYFCNDIENPDDDTWRSTYGRESDEVLTGDWENSGYDSLAVRRNGNIYYFSLGKVTEPDSKVWRTTFGRTDDQVLAGDWDGDGTDTLAMRRNGYIYYISNSIENTDTNVDRFTFGRTDDEVYAGKWR
ncbi:MAG: Ig-like domain-containing protein, partial [Lachnospiraceae bacterium]|nr:Ig-like domain-containing protein [Lachnospiraceae bacterium]